MHKRWGAETSFSVCTQHPCVLLKRSLRLLQSQKSSIGGGKLIRRRHVCLHTFVHHGGNERRGTQARYFPSNYEQSLVLSKDAHSCCYGQALASSSRVRDMLRSSRRLQARHGINKELGGNRAARTSSAFGALQEKPGGAEMRAVPKG